LSEREIVAGDLNAALDDLRREGFRLDVIYPADDPHTAILSRAADRVRLTTQPGAPEPPTAPPAFAPEFVLTRAGADGGEGRAGMLYRDLVASRLGGRYIASHITIPEGGPVSDWVHFHRIAFQMIAVRRGWVRVVYEDQGEPFVMEAGDLVLQPPKIRHRVLESSPGLEVVEITCPALHETFADHEMSLPNGRVDRERKFGGQTFLRHVAKDTPWTPFNGSEAQETAMRDATAGLAEVRVVRPSGSSNIAFAPHDGELVFGFILEGSARLDYAGSHALEPADSFVIPPAEAWTLSQPSDNLRFLHVTTQTLAGRSQSPL
jgi:mannose-6-phosphate isomerase-like protein (cupin superfamily)